MRASEENTATIEKLSHEGRGIAVVNGRTVFIQNALPNETISFRYLRQHKKIAEGIATAVLENPHPDRISPLCPHTDICAGCSLQHLSHAAQLTLKENTLKEHFTHFAQIDIAQLEPAIVKTPLHYRHKARLSVKDVLKKNKVLIGFHEHNGRYVAEISQCVVLAESIGKKLPLLTEMVSSLTLRNAIPQIEVAISDNENALIIRHVEPMNAEDCAKIIAFAEKESFSIYLYPSKGDTLTKQFPVMTDNSTPLLKLWPKESSLLLHYTLPDENCTLYFLPTEFTQINPTVNRAMVKQALNWLQPTASDVILDLFCGIGNFTLPLAKRSQQVIGIEGTESMVTRGEYNATMNHIDNVAFLCADLTQDIPHETALNKQFDKILLDPPRSGALEVIEKHFKTWNAKVIVYISCNPATLARDAGVLLSLGYRLEKISILDMFPQTSHVESMALFIRTG